MNATLLWACERFSEGNLADALPHLALDVRWVIVGERRTVEGLAALQVLARQMVGQSPSTLRNLRVLPAGESVVIEGEEAAAGSTSYCDIYTTGHDKIVEIRSYCLQKQGA